MPLCVVTGHLHDSAGVAVTNASVKVRLLTPTFNSNDILIMPVEQSVVPNGSGIFTLTLQQSMSFACDVFFPPNSEDSQRSWTYALSVPATTTANFSDIIVSE